jgi:hypothetical protein
MTITQEDFVKVLKTGALWKQKNIRDHLEEYINSEANYWTSHAFQWDNDDKQYYIYDNECYLIIEDDKITVRCDRENVSSSDMTYKYEIKKQKDIEQAYDLFKSMTMEDEQGEE